MLLFSYSILAVILSLSSLLAITHAHVASSSCVLQAVHLTTEYSLEKTVFTDVHAPRFGWWLHTSDTQARNQSQGAYQIQCSSSSSIHEADVWDSGKVR